MKQSFYLAIKYLRYNLLRTLLLVGSISVLLYLPLGLEKLIDRSEEKMMARASSTPLVIGMKGNATDLTINSLYFEQSKISSLKYKDAQELAGTDLGYQIPLISIFNARSFPIVGTNLDYFNFRDLRVKKGRKLQYIGECVLGSQVAEKLNLHPGDSIVSSPENFFDLAGTYPLQMKVVGVLESTNSSDDKAIFTDLKTNWIIMGLGHGHQDLQKNKDASVIISSDSANIVVNSKLFLYNKVSGKNPDSFHFHGDIDDYPISSVLFVPENHKSSTLLRGRFEKEGLTKQIVIPELVINNLLQNIFKIKQIFNMVFVLAGTAAMVILGLFIALSLRLRKGELYTMFTLGSSKTKTFEIISLELLITLILSFLLAIFFYGITGFFVDFFIEQLIF